MARKHYEITMTFTYKNGFSGGRLHTFVNSRKAVNDQIDANRKWLTAKGHTEKTCEFKETS
jgi:hypothetical protein